MTATIIFILRIILALLLIGFIATFFLTTSRQLNTQMKLLSPNIIINLRLSYKDKPEEDTFLIQQTDILLGRDPNCKVHIPDETISAQHARIYLIDQNWWIQDLNSTNGTFLNDERIEQPCILTNDDLIQVGNIKLIAHINV
jgi:pSer/pThr/pTyr-binding forkhead associated (FHA) protein